MAAGRDNLMDSLAHILSPSTWPLRLEYLSIPAALLVFTALAGFVLATALPRLTWLGPTRRAVAIGVRLAICWVLVMTLGGLKWWREHTSIETIVLRDVSASMGNVRTAPGTTVSDQTDAFLRRACENDTRKPDDRVGVIRIGEKATIEMLPGMPWKPRAAAIDDRAIAAGTDLDAAIRLALASFTGDAMKRITLISDGNATRGDIESAITLAASQRVPIDVIPQRYTIDREILFDRLVAPASVRAGNAFTIEAIIYSTNDQPVLAKLVVTDRGVPIDHDAQTDGGQTTRVVTLNRGPNPVHINLAPLEAGGLHAFQATIETMHGTSSDTLRANNTASACTFVRGTSRLLYVDNTRDLNRSFEHALATHFSLASDKEEGPESRPQLIRISAADFPTRLDEIESYDAIILANVPRGPGGLDDAQDHVLNRYVRDLGGGLIVIGGPEALGAGNWKNSKLETLLPLALEPDVKRINRAGAIVLVLDCSGSMNDPAPGDLTRTKQRIANDSAALALRALTPDDYVGVIAFDAKPRWVVPLARNTDPVAADAKIRTIGGGNGTAIGPALDAAIESLAKLKAETLSERRIVLVTDGVSQLADYDTILNHARSAGVMISTVAIGEDADCQLLAHLAHRGDGVAHVIRESDELSDAFVTEARRLRRSLIHEPAEPIQLLAGAATASSSALDALAQRALPPLAGIVLASPRQSAGASILLQTADAHRDPVLAIAPAGLGRVAVFTGDATSRWSSAWIASPVFATFWKQLIADVSRPRASDAFDIVIKPEGDRSRIVVEAVRDGGQPLSFLHMTGRVARINQTDVSQDVQLEQVGPGRYEGSIDTSAGGRYVASIQYSSLAGERGTLLAATTVSSGSEFQAARSNDPLLMEIASRTGGRMLSDLRESDAELFSRDGLERSASPMPLWDVLLAVTMSLLIVDVAVRRIAWDFGAIFNWLLGVFPLVGAFFSIRRVDPDSTLDSLHRARWMREHPEWMREHPEYRPFVETAQITPPIAQRAAAHPVIVDPLPASRFDARGRARHWIEKQLAQSNQKQPREVDS